MSRWRRWLDGTEDLALLLLLGGAWVVLRTGEKYGNLRLRLREYWRREQPHDRNGMVGEFVEIEKRIREGKGYAGMRAAFITELARMEDDLKAFERESEEADEWLREEEAEHEELHGNRRREAVEHTRAKKQE